jgi:hypothetical protein
MSDIRKLAEFRKRPLYYKIGNLSKGLITEILDYVAGQELDMSYAFSNRESRSEDQANEHFEQFKESIKQHYGQVGLSTELKTKIQQQLNLDLHNLRVGVLLPDGKLGWHIDYEIAYRIHCDLNLPSDFKFKIRDDIVNLEKQLGEVYAINTAHYHQLVNTDKQNPRLALLGNLSE